MDVSPKVRPKTLPSTQMGPEGSWGLREGPQVNPSDPQIYQNFDKFGGVKVHQLTKGKLGSFSCYLLGV